MIDDFQIQSLAKLFEQENSLNTCDSVNDTTGNLVFAECAKVCRVQIHGHTANINFAECAQENRRQNQSTRQSHILPCAFFWHTAKNTLPCAFFVTHGKAKLCRVFYFGTRQSNKKNFVFSPRNFFYTSHTTCDTPC